MRRDGSHASKGRAANGDVSVCSIRTWFLGALSAQYAEVSSRVGRNDSTAIRSAATQTRARYSSNSTDDRSGNIHKTAKLTSALIDTYAATAVENWKRSNSQSATSGAGPP